MKPTKQHIADKALQLFNEKGFVNIRLQHIADHAFVSVGHLAYHFKNKEAIVDHLFEELRTRQEQILAEFRVLPLFEDLQLYFRAVYQLQQHYSFFYLDTLELLRAYPGIREKHDQHIAWKTQQINHLIDFNVARGAFIQTAADSKTQLGWQLRVILDHWPYIAQTSPAAIPSVTTTPSAEHLFLQQLWGIFLPFLSDMGQREFQQLGNNPSQKNW